MNIIPINKLKETAKISDLCNQTDSPIFITKNGYGDMVIMSIKTYEKQQEQLMLKELCEKIDITTAVNGNVVMQNLKDKYVR